MAENRMLLAFMMFYALMVWVTRFFHTISTVDAMETILKGTVPCFALFTLNVLLMVELNNRNALLRTYSRTVSGTYILLMFLTPWLTADVSMLAVQTCFIAFLLLLFSTYQDRKSVGRVYFAYLFIGLASLLWTPVLLLVPFLLLFQLLYIYSLNGKSFMASLLAVLTPYWCMLSSYIIGRSNDELENVMDDVELVQVFDLGYTDTSWIYNAVQDKVMLLNIVALSMVMLLIFFGIVHYVRKCYEDKIHVRMLFYFFSFVAALLVVFVGVAMALPLVSERHFGMLLMMLIVIASPLAGHFVTFTHTRATNIFTIVFILASMAMTIFTTMVFRA